MFSYLSRIPHVTYLQFSKGHLLSDWTVPVGGPGACEGHLLCCLGQDCPQGSMKEGSWGFWPCWAEPIQDALTELPLSLSCLGHEPESTFHISVKSSGWTELFCTGPFSLLAFSENVILRKGRPEFCLCFVLLCKSMQVIEVYQSSETLPVYQLHLRRQRESHKETV